MAVRSFERLVLASCRDERLFEPGTRVLVAVSGGPDSLSLVLCLKELRRQLGIDVTVAHVHHGLRPGDAERDEEFVGERARLMGLELAVERVDVPRARLAGESIEAAARRLRYAALRRLAADAGAACIAVGHTLDDRAETVLINLVRGAGIDGLAAMRAREADIVRPLLAVSRRQVEAYLVARGVVARLDATNLDRSYRRNAVRSELIPLLERYNPRIRRTLARSAQALAADADYLEHEARRAMDAARLPSAEGTVALDRHAVAHLHTGLRAHVLRRAVEAVAGSLDGLAWEHVAALDGLVTGSGSLQCRSLPHGLVAEAEGGALLLYVPPAGGTYARPARPGPVVLPVPGVARFGVWTIRAELLPDHEGAETLCPEVSRQAVLLDQSAIAPPLLVRGRLPGDRIRPKGMQGHRKLQDILVDAKLDRSARDYVPIVADQAGILWVVGYAQEDRTVFAAGPCKLVRLSAVCETP